MARTKKGGQQEINASSMADIAFLLLIFFLVTTTIDQDKGILHGLPPWTDEPPPDIELRERNVLEILVNANNQLLVEQEYIKIDRLREITKTHLTNEGRLPNFSTSPQDAIVSLKNDRGTSYDMYIQVQNELKAAYAEVRDEMALTLSKGAFIYKEIETCAEKTNTRVSDAQRKQCDIWKQEIKEYYPMKISEAEPSGAKK
jgi:biopolymer transport protein ExbD